MSKVIAIANQKGGVGKTTTSQAFGMGLVALGKKVLFVDLDQQLSLSYILGAPRAQKTIYDALVNKLETEKAIMHLNGFDLLPGHLDLAKADMVITELGKEYRLKEVLAPIRNNYDYIIIDCPPNLNILTIAALVSADDVIIPAQADVLSVMGIKSFKETFDVVCRYSNSNLKIAGILLCKHNIRTNLSQEFTEFVHDVALNIGTKVFDTKIRETIKVREAQALSLNLLEYAPNSTVSQDYKDLVNEYINRGNQHETII